MEITDYLLIKAFKIQCIQKYNFGIEIIFYENFFYHKMRKYFNQLNFKEINIFCKRFRISQIIMEYS